MDARSLADLLKIHSHSKWIFNNSLENINQFYLEFKYKSIIFRGAIDRLMIDHEKKTIQIIDLKTGKDDYSTFFRSFLAYRYYIQSALYTIGVEAIKGELGLNDYEVLPFKFLYVGRGERIPVIFNVPKEWEKASLEGFKYGNYTYNGVDEIIDDVIWHFNNNQFELPKDIYEQQGIIDLRTEILTSK